MCVQADVPIWLHPNRPQFVADLDAYKDKGSMFQIWNTLGKITEGQGGAARERKRQGSDDAHPYT
jgi:hypothetical protein